MQEKVKNMGCFPRFSFLLTGIFLLLLCLPAVAHAACADPAGSAGEREYFTADHDYKFCDGTDWVSMSIGSSGGGGGAPTDSNFSSVVLLQHFDSDLSDSSNSNHTATANGNAAVSTAQQKFGAGAAYFDGTGDNLIIPDSADFNINDGDTTIETWVKMTNLSTGNSQGIISHYESNTARWFLGHYSYSGANAFRLIVQDGSGMADILSSGITITTGSWYHLAVVRNSGTMTLYVNGVAQGTTTRAPAIAGDLQIGSLKYDGTTGYYLNGYLDDVRITKGVARYTSGFTPPTEPFLDSGPTPTDSNFSSVVLLQHFDGNLSDVSASNHTATANGNAAVSTTQTKFGSHSLYLDGTGDYLTIPDSDDWHLGTSDFTIESWVYFNNASGFQAWAGAGAADDGAWFLSKAGFGHYPGPTYDVSTSYSFSTGQWYHVAVTRSGNTFRYFVNGVLQNSGTSSVTLANSSSAGFIMSGQYHPSNTVYNGNWMNGYLDDFRITKGTARYTGNFTPPTEAFPDEGGSGGGGGSCAASAEAFSYTGSVQTYTVPTGCSSVTVKIWGGGGGGAGDSPTSNKGGAGGYTTATMTVTAGEEYAVVVGGGGPANSAGYPRGSPGGGLSGLFTGTTAVTFDSTGQARALLVAGGGGGAGGYTSSPASGGAGGGSTGVNGGYDTRAPSNYTFGAGGTQSAGGAGGPGYSGYPSGNAGSALKGANTATNPTMTAALYGGGGSAGLESGGGAIGGGGGGGYFGGGSGAQGYAGDGGGGSGYCKSAVAITSCTTTAGSNQTPPQAGDSDYISGIGVGGAYQTAGGHGRIVIIPGS